MNYTQDFIQGFPEYDKHHLVTFLHDEETGMEAFVSIHRKNSNVPSFGATRFWHYESDSDALRDALRLSRLMSYKAALAGLPCGGAKGVIIDRSGAVEDHSSILSAYADKISMLRDSFITGTDVGVRQEELALMRERAPNIVGFNDNSTLFTSLGVYHAIKCTLREVFSDDSVAGKTFAIQGLGKIGSAVLEHLAPDAAKIYVADIDINAVTAAVKRFPSIIPVSVDAIHKQNVDVFCPCALGGAINTDNVAELSCAIVAGGANNQLENEEMGDILHKINILYAPDYVVNAGGLIAVFDEYESPTYDEERVRSKVVMIEERIQDIIAESRLQKRPTNRVANDLAESIFNTYA
ncbi:MAG TPA: Glu/Leu/Phe/Val dehydrogenase dimerization domain-containing protein [Candidatus Paceibacterota bacterium]